MRLTGFLPCLYSSILLLSLSSLGSKGEKAETTAKPLAKLAPAPVCAVIALERPKHKVVFRVEVARTAYELEHGLMNRRALPQGSGMLFVFPVPRAVSFWMKDTFIPLDMVFIEESGAVVQFHERAEPLTLDLINSGTPVKYVLELPAGSIRHYHIQRGDHLIPSKQE